MDPTTSLTRHKAVWGDRVVRCALAVLVLLSSSCSETTRTGQASSYLVITNLVGGPQTDNTVESDVISDDGTVFTDVAEVTLQLQMKDPNGLGPSPVNSITLTQYRVEYVRSDGRNVEGVDVPFSFTSGVTATVSNSASVGFTLVRLQAKQESPLRALRSGGGARIISTIARITFYGRDQTGREVSVTGNLDVTFADWAG
jgi:hypothetical protein